MHETLLAKDYLESERFPFYIEPYQIGPGGTIPPHSHEFIEFVYILEGTGHHLYKGQEHQISSGDVFIIAPGVSHAYRVSGSSHLVVYNVLFYKDVFARELEVLAEVTPFVGFFYVEPFLRNAVDFQSHLRLTPSERLEASQLLERIHAEFDRKLPGYRIVIKTRLIELFVFLSRTYGQRVATPLAHDAKEDEVMERVCAFVASHYAQPLSLAQMSQLCGLSSSSFTAKFKRFSGQTFIEYRNQMRVEAAKHFLLTTQKLVTDIAKDVGFDDISFFNKEFKRRVGMPPSLYRSHSNEQQT